MDPMVEPWDDEEKCGRASFVRPDVRRLLLVLSAGAQRRSGTQDAGEADEGNVAADEVSWVSAFAEMTP